jgi:hypothetical protein
MTDAEHNKIVLIARLEDLTRYQHLRPAIAAAARRAREHVVIVLLSPQFEENERLIGARPEHSEPDGVARKDGGSC